jgi:hypothetical protein
MNAYWSYLLTGVGITGLYLAGRRKAWGWAVGIGAQSLWVTYAIATHQWGFIVSSVAYTVVYTKNFLAWQKPVSP